MKMKISDIDIWAVSISQKSEKKRYNEGYYQNNHFHKPLFIAKREWDNNLKRSVIKELRLVTKIYKKGGYSKLPDSCVYKLGETITLAKPISKNGEAFSQNSAISMSFSEIKVLK